MSHVAILGMMGVGKSTTASALAERLDRPHRDSDADIERREGRTGRAIAEAEGVERLHELEAEVLLDALASAEPVVVSAAGSVVDRADCRDALRHHATVIVLELDTSRLVERIASGSHRRPMAAADLDEAAHRREPLFAEVADVVLDASDPVDDIVTAITDFLTTPS